MERVETGPGTEYEETEWMEMKDDEEGFSSMFANPDPYETFVHNFELVEKESKRDITVTLVGRRADEAQTLNSTGLTLWRAAPLLCNYLIVNPGFIREKKVLELGAGMGLCGILAAALGAEQICLSDGDSYSLSNMRENVERNRNIIPESSNVQCLQLRWGLKLEEFKRRCNTQLFDTILGSDIIYVESILEPLFQTVQGLLHPNGTFILAYARRNVKIEYVFQTAKEFGFKWTEPTSEEGCFLFSRQDS